MVRVTITWSKCEGVYHDVVKHDLSLGLWEPFIRREELDGVGESQGHSLRDEGGHSRDHRELKPPIVCGG